MKPIKNKNRIIKQLIDHVQYFGSKDEFEQSEIIVNGNICKMSFVYNKYRDNKPGKI